MFLQDDYPKRWADMSFEFRAVFVYFTSMMAMLLTSGLLNMGIELAVAFALIAIILLLSLRRRRMTGWRVPAIGIKQVGSALLTVVFVCIFVFAALPHNQPLNAHILPFYLVIAGIGIFNFLNALKIVALSEKVFKENCIGNKESSQEEKIREALWKKMVRIVFYAVFLCVWLDGMAFFYFFNQGVQAGSGAPTATHSERLVNHAQIVYITPQQKTRIDSLQSIMSVGIPCVFIGGLLLNFYIGGIFPNGPTLEQWKKKRSSGL